MGLLDIFSGTPGRNAAVWSAGTTQSGADRQRGYIQDYGQLSLGALQGGMSDARTYLEDQYNLRAPPTLRAGQQSALGTWAPLGEIANRGYSSYADASGVNGIAGNDRARANFRAGPGYEFMVNEGVNAATRAANATGMGASGNTLDAVTRLGSNLADQQWDQYIGNLKPWLEQAPGIAGKQADLYTGTARDLAGLQTDFAKTMASLNTGFGTGRAGIYSQQGANLSNITGAETSARTAQGQAGLLAGQQGQANAWSAGMNLANLGANVAGRVQNPFG
jgi:hypothetical protein